MTSHALPPVAPKRPHPTTVHGVTLTDDYHWMRERGADDVLAHLRAENAYTEAMTEHTAALRETLFAEMRSRMQETDTSAWSRVDDRFYYHRTVEGLQYPIHCRKTGSLEADEEVLLDENELAAAAEYFALGVFAPSPDHSLLAYSTDTDGGERYTLVVKDLSSGELFGDHIENTGYSLAWANDGRTLFYTVLDDARRPFKVLRHVLGTDPAADEVVFHESDEAFGVGIGRSPSKRFLLLGASSSVTTEGYLLDADDPSELRLIAPRRPGIEYDAVDHRDRLLIRTNDGAHNFRLMEAPLEQPGAWRELIAGRDDVKLEDVTALRDHLILTERVEGLISLRVIEVDTGREHTIEMPEPVYVTGPGGNANVDTHVFRYVYTSPVSPPSWVDYDLASRERDIIKQHPVPGYDPDRYTTERIWAVAPDLVRVPITVLRHRDTALDGRAPLLLQGYGSYGISEEPSFVSSRLSLVDRGMIFALAHVRGGGELGEPWRDDGKLQRKRNTFTDFIACAEHLIASGYAARDRLAIKGGSAGGLLMGAVTNMRPDLFAAVVAQVPFVDVINTMLDRTLPLTVGEFAEWGNPGEDEQAFAMIRSYSPYDNIAALDYPPILVTGGINDPRVQYWEPAKYVARIREHSTSGHPIVLRMQMGEGHSGPSGRYDALRETAFVFAFVLDQLGAAELTREPAAQA